MDQLGKVRKLFFTILLEREKPSNIDCNNAPFLFRKGMRQPTHSRAWNSPKRAALVRGQRFKLDDTRVWMRLMFLSGREIGLARHEPFWNWFIGFIRHFIAIYERGAPAYAQESADWSENPANVQKYNEDGCKICLLYTSPSPRDS